MILFAEMKLYNVDKQWSTTLIRNRVRLDSIALHNMADRFSMINYVSAKLDKVFYHADFTVTLLG